jgi:hypothetical protein
VRNSPLTSPGREDPSPAQELGNRFDEKAAKILQLTLADAVDEAEGVQVDRPEPGHFDECAIWEHHEGGDPLIAGDGGAQGAQLQEQLLLLRIELPRRAGSLSALLTGAAVGLGPEGNGLAPEQDGLTPAGQTEAWRMSDRQTRCERSWPTPKVFSFSWPLRRMASVSRPPSTSAI